MASTSSTAFLDPQLQTTADRDRLFDLSYDLLCIAGLDGYFKQVNPSWTRVFGWSREELLSRPVIEFMHPDDRERTLAARAGLARGIPVRELENRYLGKDGSYRWLSWHSTVEPGGTTVFGVARDITERRLRDQKQLVMSKLESTGILAGGIAHDFNNLLACLLLNLEMISVAGGTNDRQQDFIQQGMKNIRAAHALTQELLVFARGGAHDWKIFDLRILLRQSLDLALSGSNIQGELTLADDLRSVRLDESQISLAFRNIVLNAREAMPSGGTVRLHATNTILPGVHTPAGLPAGDYLHIIIADEGDGISREELPKIFDPYFSTKQRGSQRGMGLGLTICHSIVEKHGGAITVHSQSGQGTQVHCWLPAAPLPPETRTTGPDPSPLEAAPKILVMDDEPGLRSILAQSLEGIGFQVELACHGEEAITIYKNARDNGSPFAAVLLDLTVRGGMGGCETMQLLRDYDPAVKGVLITGYHRADIFRDYAKHGFALALPKPFSMDNLRDTLSTVLGACPTLART